MSADNTRADEAETIVVLGAQPEYLSGLRGPMIRDFLDRGYRVVAIGAEEHAAVRATLESWGAEYRVVPMRRTGLNPLRDAATLWSLYRTLRHLRPGILFAYTVKPVVYGLAVGWAAGVKRRYAMIAGRGFPFLPGKGFKRHLARIFATLAYRFSLHFATGVIFQNEDDRQLFRDRRMLPAKVPATRVFGSGVELDRHRPAPMPPLPLAFLMIGRLVAHKGVFEYIEAAKRMRATNPEMVFRLVGPTDPSPNGISPQMVEELRSQGCVEYLGALDDVRPALAASHIFVLPSHGGEGVPRSILEAMATARPVVTTDTPGCRDAVVDGVNGYVVPPHDIAALVQALSHFIDAPDLMAQMGQRSLEFAHGRFDVEKVNAAIGEFMNLLPTELSATHAVARTSGPL